MAGRLILGGAAPSLNTMQCIPRCLGLRWQGQHHFGELHLRWNESLVSCIYDAMNLWCAESLVHRIFVVLQLLWIIWRSDSLIVNLEVLFATQLEKLFWGFQWSREVMFNIIWPNKAMNTKICIRKFLGAFNNQNCWNCQHSHHHEVFSHFFSLLYINLYALWST